jgi:hypothetical protein
MTPADASERVVRFILEHPYWAALLNAHQGHAWTWQAEMRRRLGERGDSMIWGRQYVSPCVVKSWHRPPGRASDFRGWAVMVDGTEVSLHETATEAYADLVVAEDWILLSEGGMSAVRLAQKARL